MLGNIMHGTAVTREEDLAARASCHGGMPPGTVLPPPDPATDMRFHKPRGEIPACGMVVVTVQCGPRLVQAVARAVREFLVASSRAEVARAAVLLYHRAGCPPVAVKNESYKQMVTLYFPAPMLAVVEADIAAGLASSRSAYLRAALAWFLAEVAPGLRAEAGI
jgi:hypothetical protein